MKDIAISSNELVNQNPLNIPEKAKGFSDSSFWYYTSLNTARLILKNKCIYISNLETMNDVDEAVFHKEHKTRVHCFCLCNSNTEKIPMWYLYAGIAGKGLSIGFTPLTMIRLLQSINEVKTPDNERLFRGKDFDMKFGWVFYQKKESPSQIKYKGKWYSLDDETDFIKGNYFVKYYPWEYENEFRVVFINNTNKSFKKLVLNLEPVYDKLKLKLAPEIKEEEINDFLEFSHFKHKKSDLAINMNLFKRNYNSFLEYLNNNASNDIDYNQICEIASKQVKCKGVK